MTEGELTALAEKYREMIALRRDTGPRDDTRLRALATRFPGVLRELDSRTMVSLEQRLAELEAARAGGPEPAWASLQLRFHGWLRVAIRIRAAGGDADAWVIGYAPSDPGDPPSIDAAALAMLLSPAEGRISLAARALLGAPDIDLDLLLFGRKTENPERSSEQ